MALNSSHLLHHSLYLSLQVLIIVPLFFFPLLFSPVFSLSNSNNHPTDPSTRGLLFEEKSRLGSTPPSCYNKCNQCHPCTAVQVPTLPSLHRVQPPLSHESTSSVAITLEYDSTYGNNRYSNYKPLGWKCRCRDHFYNP